jgi:Recombination endonuclease VII
VKTCRGCGQDKPRSEFYAHSATCKTCRAQEYQGDKAARSAYWQKRYAKNRDALIAYQGRYREENVAKIAARDRTYYLRNQRKIEDARRLKKYGVTRAQYDAMLDAQGSGCAVCRAPRPGGGKEHFHVDHDHGTGVVRGLLCGACNTAIGLLRDDPAIADKVAAYLRRQKAAA